MAAMTSSTTRTAITFSSRAGDILSVFEEKDLRKLDQHMLQLLKSDQDRQAFCAWMEADAPLSSACLLRTTNNSFIWLDKVPYDTLSMRFGASAYELEFALNHSADNSSLASSKSRDRSDSFSFDELFELDHTSKDGSLWEDDSDDESSSAVDNEIQKSGSSFRNEQYIFWRSNGSESPLSS